MQLPKSELGSTGLNVGTDSNGAIVGVNVGKAVVGETDMGTSVGAEGEAVVGISVDVGANVGVSVGAR